jgi:hypothetical protein
MVNTLPFNLDNLGHCLKAIALSVLCWFKSSGLPMSEESFHLNRINSAWDRKAREAIETLSCYLEAAISTRIASICCLAVSRYSWGKVASINKSFVLLGLK